MYKVPRSTLGSSTPFLLQKRPHLQVFNPNFTIRLLKDLKINFCNFLNVRFLNLYDFRTVKHCSPTLFRVAHLTVVSEWFFSRC